MQDSVTEVVWWQLPRAERTAAIEPNPSPVFTEAHDYQKYTMRVAGFTGGELQAISHWEVQPASRFTIPGYKGALSRFEDGELLVCPQQGRCNRIYRSCNDGVSWERSEMRGEEMPRKEQAMLCLSDGKTVLLQTEASQNPLYRSSDRGVTWERVDYGSPTGTIRNFIETSDGSVFMFGYTGTWEPKRGTPNFSAWKLRSRNGGKSWEREEVKAWSSPYPFFCEANFLPFSDTYLLAAVRVHGSLAREIAGGFYLSEPGRL